MNDFWKYRNTAFGEDASITNNFGDQYVDPESFLIQPASRPSPCATLSLARYAATMEWMIWTSRPRFEIDDAGNLRTAVFQRWGDPGNTGEFGWHAFGMSVAGHSTFGGLTVSFNRPCRMALRD